MIVDRIERLPLYESQIPGAREIAEAFSAGQPEAAPCEVREKRYAPKPPEQRRFEVHFHTIDLMMAKSGAEVIHRYHSAINVIKFQIKEKRKKWLCL